VLPLGEQTANRTIPTSDGVAFVSPVRELRLQKPENGCRGRVGLTCQPSDGCWFPITDTAARFILVVCGERGDDDLILISLALAWPARSLDLAIGSQLSDGESILSVEADLELVPRFLLEDRPVEYWYILIDPIGQRVQTTGEFDQN